LKDIPIEIGVEEIIEKDKAKHSHDKDGDPYPEEEPEPFFMTSHLFILKFLQAYSKKKNPRFEYRNPRLFKL
jgi:hypothetical protein